MITKDLKTLYHLSIAPQHQSIDAPQHQSVAVVIQRDSDSTGVTHTIDIIYIYIDCWFRSESEVKFVGWSEQVRRRHSGRLGKRVSERPPWIPFQYWLLTPESLDYGGNPGVK